MKKRIVSIILTLGLIATGLCGCGQGDSDKAKGETEEGNIEEITYAFATFTSVPTGTEEVEEAINEITEKEIGVHVNLLILDPANYSQQIALMISSKQDLDMFHTLGDLSQYVASNEIMPLDELISEYGSDITSIEPDYFMEAGVINGEQYGIPFYMGKALAPTVIFRQDILDELKIDADTITSFEELDKVYEKVHEAHPELTILSPLNSGDCGIQYLSDNIDYLTDSHLTPTGVLIGDSTEVQNYYETDEFEKIVKLARSWYDKGYVSSDAATTTMLASAEMSAGTSFSAIGGYAGMIPESQFAAPADGSLGSARIGSATISTSDVNTLSRVISVNSKHAGAAMKFLNLCYTNKDIASLLTLGIEGRDYNVVDDTFVSYPEGQSMFTVPYNTILSASTSNQFIDGRILVGQDKTDTELQKTENDEAWRSQAFGFTFDSTNVKTQYSAVNNVINQYLPGLVCGALNPDTELANFQKALEDAGINDIVKEKQVQLDKWLSEAAK